MLIVKNELQTAVLQVVDLRGFICDCLSDNRPQLVGRGRTCPFISDDRLAHGTIYIRGPQFPSSVLQTL